MPDLNPGLDILRAQKSKSWQVFDRISGRYDRVNHILSWGLDGVWRQALARCVAREKPSALLDLATGTGEVVFAICRACPGLSEAYGLDLSEEMLALARRKSQNQTVAAKIHFLVQDARDLDFPDQKFSVVTAAFGLRNMPDVERVLEAVRRVLSSGGVFFVLDFSFPENRLVRFFCRLYLKFIMPGVGGIISGDFAAFRYFQDTLFQFPQGPAFVKLLEDQGFSPVSRLPLSAGIVTLYRAVRP